MTSLLRDIRTLVLDAPEVRAWPEMVEIVRKLTDAPREGSLEFPVVGAQAVGGTLVLALPAGAASYCLQMSIHLVDDMLDQEAHGLFRKLGEAQVANLALAFQAVALRIADDAEIAPAERCALLRSLAEVGVATAYGQAVEAGLPDDETGYWLGARSKTPPLFSVALFAGALLGGASEETARRIESLGEPIGLMIQVQDDLGDAMGTPAKPDWRFGHNLPILYARTAKHDERASFEALLQRIEEPDALSEAQQILFRSGAVSYCCHRVLELHRTASAHVDTLDVPNAKRLSRLLGTHIEPVLSMLRRAGVTSPESLVHGPESHA